MPPPAKIPGFLTWPLHATPRSRQSPAPGSASLEHSAATADHLRAAIRRVRLAAVRPLDGRSAVRAGAGYYAAGNVKLADPADAAALPAGDFVTAPQLTPLFARTLARQAADVLAQTGTSAVLEFGAGTGALAEGVRELDALGQAHTDYLILEVSADLRAVQAKRLAPSVRACAGWTRCRRPSRAACWPTKCWTPCRCRCSAGAKTQCRWNAAWPLARMANSSGKTARPASRWRPRWPSACRPCPAMYPRSICRPRPGSARWAAGWNAARRC